MEFESSPLIGVGFDAIDLNLSSASGGYDKDSGMVESGSSWLIILSMTGLIGAILLFPVLLVLTDSFGSIHRRRLQYCLACSRFSLST